MSTTIMGPDGKSRGRWCGAAPEFLDYHDTERNRPLYYPFQSNACVPINTGFVSLACRFASVNQPFEMGQGFAGRH